MKCEGCLAADCGSCIYCMDKNKFGGPGKKKRKCITRKCTASLKQVNIPSIYW